MDRPAFSAGAVFIDPSVTLSGTSGAGNSLDAHNIAPETGIPNIHYIHPLNAQWWVGASLTSNFGLSTKFANHYSGVPFAGKTDLMSANVNLSTAHRFNRHFTFGVGFDAVYARAKIERYAGELGAMLPAELPVLSANTQIAHLKGNKWGYGWNAGILYELNDNNRFGLTYRSEIKVGFSGNYKSTIPAKYNSIITAFGLPMGTSGISIPGSLSLHLPAIWEISAYHRLAPHWAIHYGLALTSWHQFKELKATNSDGQTLFYKEEGFRDAYRVAAGTSWYYDDNWTFRAGVAFDESPVPADKRSISIPDQDRIWLSLGATYAFNDNTSVDMGISYMHGKKVTIREGVDLAATGANNGIPVPYLFDASGKAWLYGASFNYRF